MKRELIALVVASAIAGCGSDDNTKTQNGTNTGTVKLSGVLGTSFQTVSKANRAMIGSAAATTDSAVNEVWAAAAHSASSRSLSGNDR